MSGWGFGSKKVAGPDQMDMGDIYNSSADAVNSAAGGTNALADLSRGGQILQQQPQQQPQSSNAKDVAQLTTGSKEVKKSSSGYFDAFFGTKNEASNASEKTGAEVQHGAEEEDEAEETKKEGMMVRTVRAIKNKFIARGLEGKLYIYRVSGVINTAVTCTIKETDEATKEEDLSDLPFTDRRALSMCDSILDSLERRSRAWENAGLIEDVIVTRGATIGVRDPFVGLIGFSITLELTATVKSLIASRKRSEASRKGTGQSHQQPERRTSLSGMMAPFSKFAFGATSAPAPAPSSSSSSASSSSLALVDSTNDPGGERIVHEENAMLSGNSVSLSTPSSSTAVPILLEQDQLLSS